MNLRSQPDVAGVARGPHREGRTHARRGRCRWAQEEPSCPHVADGGLIRALPAQAAAPGAWGWRAGVLACWPVTARLRAALRSTWQRLTRFTHVRIVERSTVAALVRFLLIQISICHPPAACILLLDFRQSMLSPPNNRSLLERGDSSLQRGNGTGSTRASTQLGARPAQVLQSPAAKLLHGRVGAVRRFASILLLERGPL